MTLMLFDEAHVLAEEDKGFFGALASIIAGAKVRRVVPYTTAVLQTCAPRFPLINIECMKRFAVRALE